MVIYSLVAGSAIAAGYTLIQALHIPTVNQWTFDVYFANKNYPDYEAIHFASQYFRTHGVAGPNATAIILSGSVGGWLALLIQGSTRNNTIIATAGLAPMSLPVRSVTAPTSRSNKPRFLSCLASPPGNRAGQHRSWSAATETS